MTRKKDLAAIPQEILYDRRLAERYLREGILTSEQLEAELSRLPDRADNVEPWSTNETLEVLATLQPVPSPSDLPV